MSNEIQVPPPPHVKFDKRGRAYVEIGYLIDRELKRMRRSEEVEQPSTEQSSEASKNNDLGKP